MCYKCSRYSNQFFTIDNYDLMDSEDESNLDIADDMEWFIDYEE